MTLQHWWCERVTYTRAWISRISLFSNFRVWTTRLEPVEQCIIPSSQTTTKLSVNSGWEGAQTYKRMRYGQTRGCSPILLVSNSSLVTPNSDFFISELTLVLPNQATCLASYSLVVVATIQTVGKRDPKLLLVWQPLPLPPSSSSLVGMPA